MSEAKTHLGLTYGQMTQMEAGAAFPTSREEAMYLVGNGVGLDDGEIYYNTSSGVVGVHVGGSWLFIEFTHTL